MRTQVSVLTVLLAVLAAFVLLAPGVAMAAATPAGTQIANDARLDYKVGGVLQPFQTSVANTLFVDARVNFTITNSSDHISNAVASGGAGDTYWIEFLVTNTGNVGIDLAFAPALNSGQWTQGVTFYVDSNNNGTYDTGVDIKAFVDELGIGLTNNVFAVADPNIPAQADGDYSNLDVTATAYYNSGGTLSGAVGDGKGIISNNTVGNVDNSQQVNGIDWELADTGNNGTETANDAFLVSAATLTITKTSRVIWDPINTGTNPIAIPGARISYTITVASTGGSPATQVRILDTITSPMVYNSPNIYYNHSGTGVATLLNGNYGADGNESGIVNGEWSGTSVIVNGIALTSGQNAYIVFQTYLP